VGITGDPDEVRGFGKLVKNSVELMLKESFVLEQLQTETKARERLLHEILRGNLDYDGDIIERAKLLRCEIFFPLVAMVIDLQEIDHISLQQWLGQTPKHELDLENMLTNAVKHLGYVKNNSSMITSMGKNRIIVLQFIASKSKQDDKDMMAAAVKYASQYLKDLKGAFNVKVSVGIGSMATRMQDVCRTYKEACLVLKIANRLSYTGNIHCWQDIGLGLLLETTPGEVVDHFKQRVNLPKLINSKLVDTFKVFFDCNLCVSEAANKLYIHRNTLAYRLNRIKEITGLDPRNIYDAMHIYLALLFNTYYSV
jgi:carbohydrate diacid regulator